MLKKFEYPEIDILEIKTQSVMLDIGVSDGDEIPDDED